MFTEQNSAENIKYLRAMRYYYSKAKKIKTLIFLISILFPISFIIYRYFKNIEYLDLSYDNLMVSGALLWILIVFFLERKADKLTSIGSKIQEKFDTNIFDIPQNNGLIYSDVSDEIIYDGSKNFKGDEESLKNWYGKRKVAPHYLKVLISQRMNIIWGNELKEKYKKVILLFLIIIMSTSFLSSIILNLNFIDSIIFLVIPFIPLFYIGLKNYLKIYSQINNNKNINNKILVECENINDNTRDKCRMYQDYIYVENRLNSILIPDFFYKNFRDDMEDKLIEINNELFKKYKS